MRIKTRRWNRLRTYAAICWCGMAVLLAATGFQAGLVLPAWFDTFGPIAVGLLGVAGGVLAAKSYRPLPPGYCQICEYDLRGNTSGRCSECGEPFKLP